VAECDIVDTMPIKQRNITKTNNAGFLSQYKIGSGGLTNYGSSFIAITRSSDLSSINTSSGTDGRFRPCAHDQSLASYYDVPLGLTLTATGSNVSFFPNSNLPVRVGPTSVSLPSPLSASQWEALDAQALAAMLPSASSGLSIINAVYELKDFRHLAQAIWDRNGVIAKVLGVSSLKFSELMKHPLRELSSAYLNYSFAWRPLVSDVQAVYNALLNTERRLKDIWNRQDKPQTRHYTWILDNTQDNEWSDLSAPAFVANNNLIGSDGRKSNLVIRSRERWVQTPVYHATVRFTYKVPGALDEAARFRGWLDAFGVRLDPSIIWNAIPFSFIIDWIADVGGYLRRFSSDNLGLQVSIEDFCSSTRFHKLGESYLSAIADSTPIINPLLRTYSPGNFLCSQFDKISYDRRTGIPNLHTAVALSPLSYKEVSLGAALLTSGGRRPQQ
jgi:hypothetical protein